MGDNDIPGGTVVIRGDRLVLRALRPAEIDQEWHRMASSDPMAIAQLPDETRFRARLARSGQMRDGWLDLAIDLDGAAIGRIQTFVPPHRPTPPGTYTIGIGLEPGDRGKGYGREALALLTDWLFAHAAAEIVEAPTDPDNGPMRAVFVHVGWSHADTITDYDRAWVVYRITRDQWQERQHQPAP